MTTDTPTGFECIGHFYDPIPYFEGRVLKYQGQACARNVEWMMKIPGMLMLDAYHGDRIHTDTLKPHFD